LDTEQGIAVGASHLIDWLVFGRSNIQAPLFSWPFWKLEEAVARLSAKGATELTVVPVFFGQGGHLRNDFPVLLEECRGKFPNIQLSTTPAVGEDLAVLQAIVDFGSRNIGS
jgi:sirohydrochlorin ferrochelatase